MVEEKCDFCSGKSIKAMQVIRSKNTREVEYERYLDDKIVLIDKEKDREYYFGINFCPMCGERLKRS